MKLLQLLAAACAILPAGFTSARHSSKNKKGNPIANRPAADALQSAEAGANIRIFELEKHGHEKPPIPSSLISRAGIEKTIKSLKEGDVAKELSKQYGAYYIPGKPRQASATWQDVDIQLSQISAGDVQFHLYMLCNNPLLQKQNTLKKDGVDCNKPYNGEMSTIDSWNGVFIVEEVFQVNDTKLGIISVMYSREFSDPIISYQPGGIGTSKQAKATAINLNDLTVSFTQAVELAKAGGLDSFNYFTLNAYGKSANRRTKAGQAYYTFSHVPPFGGAAANKKKIPQPHTVGAKNGCEGKDCYADRTAKRQKLKQKQKQKPKPKPKEQKEKEPRRKQEKGKKRTKPKNNAAADDDAGWA